MFKGRKFTQLSEGERSKIEVLLHQGFSYGAIASALDRSVSTISREVRRNGLKKGGYQALQAQGKAQARHRNKAKHLVFDQRMKEYVSASLRERKWSPELISAKGKQQCSQEFISSEWIYQWIWRMKFSQKAGERGYRHLYECLRHAFRKRKRGNRRGRRGNILKRRWIEERPKQAQNRKQTGHLECDIMLGKDRKPGLVVVLDRYSRKTWIRHLKTKDSGYVIGKVKRIARSCGARTITFDNDQSFATHYQLHALGIQTFFTHPYRSQQKGSVENRIGLIRLFFPKQTDFSLVSQKEVKKVENLINNRPLRMFGYKSPNELYI